MNKYRIKQVITRIWDVEIDNDDELCAMDAISSPKEGYSTVRLLSEEDLAEVVES